MVRQVGEIKNKRHKKRSSLILITKKTKSLIEKLFWQTFSTKIFIHLKNYTLFKINRILFPICFHSKQSFSYDKLALTYLLGIIRHILHIFFNFLASFFPHFNSISVFILVFLSHLSNYSVFSSFIVHFLC